MLATLVAAASSALLHEPKPPNQPLTAAISRRAALLGGAAAFMQAASCTSASAGSPDNLSSILERAEKGTLRATPVLKRAVADTLVNPKDINTCRQASPRQPMRTRPRSRCERRSSPSGNILLSDFLPSPCADPALLLCPQLTSIIDADSEVLYDILPAARTYVREIANQYGVEDYRGGSSSDTRRVLEGMLEDEKLARTRLSKQLNLLSEQRSERGCP